MQNDNEEKTTDDLNFTQENVEEIAKRLTNDPSTKLVKYDFCEISKTKLGMLGDHKSLKITFKRKGQDRPETRELFVKSIPCDERQKNVVITSGCFVKELSFFEKIAPELLKNYMGEKWLPTCYSTTDNALIMENLLSQGYKLVDDIFDVSVYLKSALSALARFHGCSILCEYRLSQEAKRPVTLSELFPDCFESLYLSPTAKVHDYFLYGVDLACEFARSQGLDSRSLLRAYDAVYDAIKPSSTWGCRNVVVHSDLWRNNLMFRCRRREADLAPLLLAPQCVLVDFQSCVYGPQVLDVLQLLYLNSSGAYRAEFEADLIGFYRSELVAAIRRGMGIGNEDNDDDAAAANALIPELADIAAAYEELRLYGAVMLSYYMPFTFFYDDKSTSGSDDEDKSSMSGKKEFADYVFSDRKALTLAHLEGNEGDRKAFGDVLVELVKLGDRL